MWLLLSNQVPSVPESFHWPRCGNQLAAVPSDVADV
eukprot:COSAG01_NODE_13870_length_1525_cov_1.012623_1_plen_35_part_10